MITAVNVVLMPTSPQIAISNEQAEMVQAQEARVQTLEEMVAEKSSLNGINEKKVLFIAECESKMNLRALGDGHLICSKTGKPMRSRGIWQINECGHPEVTDEQAFDPVKSTDWAMEIFKKGNEAQEWAICTQKYLRTISKK